MSRIILFRHGKADEPSLRTADFDRGLTDRGRDNVRRIGHYLAEHRMLPDLILVSTAIRTRQTYEMAAANWPDIPAVFMDRIYEANADILLGLITEQAAEAESVMLIGHNPSFVVLLNHMVGPRHSDDNLSYFPTSCVAEVEFAAPLIGDIEADAGKLLSMIRVRDLEEGQPKG